MSDRNAKADVEPADNRQILEALAEVVVSTWRYKTQDADIRHIGPMAQDLHAAFGYGESDKSISTVDGQGIAFAAIQGLYQVVQEKDARIQALEEQVAELRRMIVAGRE